MNFFYLVLVRSSLVSGATFRAILDTVYSKSFSKESTKCENDIKSEQIKMEWCGYCFNGTNLKMIAIFFFSIEQNSNSKLQK